LCRDDFEDEFEDTKEVIRIRKQGVRHVYVGSGNVRDFHVKTITCLQ